MGDGIAGVDLLIGEADLIGLGLGSRILAEYARGLVFADPAVTACVAHGRGAEPPLVARVRESRLPPRPRRRGGRRTAPPDAPRPPGADLTRCANDPVSDTAHEDVTARPQRHRVQALFVAEAALSRCRTPGQCRDSAVERHVWSALGWKALGRRGSARGRCRRARPQSGSGRSFSAAARWSSAASVSPSWAFRAGEVVEDRSGVLVAVECVEQDPLRSRVIAAVEQGEDVDVRLPRPRPVGIARPPADRQHRGIGLGRDGSTLRRRIADEHHRCPPARLPARRRR